MITIQSRHCRRTELLPFWCRNVLYSHQFGLLLHVPAVVLMCTITHTFVFAAESKLPCFETAVIHVSKYNRHAEMTAQIRLARARDCVIGWYAKAGDERQNPLVNLPLRAQLIDLHPNLNNFVWSLKFSHLTLTSLSLSHFVFDSMFLTVCQKKKWCLRRSSGNSSYSVMFYAYFMKRHQWRPQSQWWRWINKHAYFMNLYHSIKVNQYT